MAPGTKELEVMLIAGDNRELLLEKLTAGCDLRVKASPTVIVVTDHTLDAIEERESLLTEADKIVLVSS